MPKLDVLLSWINVHGGNYHKLIHLHEKIKQAGMTSRLLINMSPPTGLQMGVDVDQSTIDRLAEQGVFFLEEAELVRQTEDTPARLVLFDAHRGEVVPRMIKQVRERGDRSAQLSAMLGEFINLGADFAVLQHPCALAYALDFTRARRKRRPSWVSDLRKIYFSGNIYYEPVVNRWTSDIRSRTDFFVKYGLDPNKKSVLWFPNREDVTDPCYAEVVRAVRESGHNLVIKMHPWEYKQIGHGYDPCGVGKTSAEIWGVKAIEERDSSWAMKFCDLGVVRDSAMGLELAFWSTPTAYLPSSSGKSGLFWVKQYLALTGDSAVRFGSPREMQTYLETRGVPTISDKGFTKAQASIMTDADQGDSFSRLVRDLDSMLNDPLPKSMRLADICALYKHKIPLRIVPPGLWPSYLFARIRRKKRRG